MRKVMENLTGAMAAAVVAVGAAEAGPFRVVSDGPESVWVLDAGSGELVWCRTRAPSGPKVVDVFGADAQAREATPRRDVPTCSVAQAGTEEDPRAVRARAMLGYGGDAGYGYLLAACGAGGVVGALIAPRLSAARRPSRAVAAVLSVTRRCWPALTGSPTRPASAASWSAR